MMLTLRGLPPDIEVSEIRSYIHARCAVGRVLLDELEAEAGGTRRVTMATMSDADAATLRRTLSGERLGVYTLLVEPYRAPDATDINFRDNGGLGNHGGYDRRATGGTVERSRNSDKEVFSSSRGRGGNSFRGLGRNSRRGGSGFSAPGGSKGRDGDGFGSRGGSYEGESGDLGGLRGIYGRDGRGSSGHGGSYEGESVGLEGHRRSYGRDGGGLGVLGGNNMRDSGQFPGSDGLGKRYRGDDSIGGGSSKRWRDSGRDDGLGSGSGDTFDAKRETIFANSSRGRGGYSGPHGSREGGLVEYNDANYSRDGGAFGGYSRDREPNSFSGGNVLGRNVVREPSPRTYGNKRESGKVPPWEHHSPIEDDRQSVEMEDCSLVAESRDEDYSQARSYSRERDSSMHTSRMHQQNRAPDSGRFEGGIELSSGRVPPWLANREGSAEVSRERSRSPVMELPLRRDSAWGSERAGTRLARRPADRALPDRRRPRSRSPSPPYRGAQPPPGNQQRDRPFEQSAPRMNTAPWLVAKPIAALMSRGPSQTPFSVSVNCPNSDLSNETWPAKNKALLVTPQIVKVQKFSQNPAAQSGELGLKSDSIYKSAASNILDSVVDYKRVIARNRSNATSFASVMKHLIEKRLRELTKEYPFKKDLVSIYRKAYPPSSDEESMNSVIEQLSLPEIPIPLKVRATNQKTLKRKFGHILDTNFTDLTKYINPQIKVDARSKKNIEDNVEAKKFHVRLGAIIADQLLKIDIKGHRKKLNAEEMRLRSYLKDLIVTVLAKFPQKEFFASQDVNVILRMYHEKMSADRNRSLIDMAIVKCNAKENVPYKGIFTVPDKAATIMQLWPDLYLKPGEAAPTPANAAEVSKEVKIRMWLDYASTVIASEVFVRHREKYQMHKDELSINEIQHRVRSWLQDRMNDLTPSDNSGIVSSHSLVALYRRAYPQETDAELLDGVIKQLLEEAAARGDGYLETVPVRMLSTSATIALASEAVYGRQITADERGRLRWTQRNLLLQMQTHIRKRIRRMLSRRGVAVHSEGQIRAAYREEFPACDDKAFVRAIITKMERSEPPVGHEPDATMQTDGDINQGEVSAHVVRCWRDSLIASIADGVLFRRVMNKKDRETLAPDALAKLRMVRDIVREQMDEIIADARGAVTTMQDLNQIYRELHPLREDAALKERVEVAFKGDVAPKTAKEIADRKIASWRDSITCQVVDEALFGEIMNAAQRKAMSRDAQQMFRLAREVVLEQFKKDLTDELGAVNSRCDLLKLYRKYHPTEEDSALRACVMRQTDEIKETARLKKAAAKDNIADKVELSLDVTFNNPSQGENKGQQRIDNVKPSGGTSVDSRIKHNLTTETVDGKTKLTTNKNEDDEMKTTNTDVIEDNVDFASYDIDVNDDDLEDY